MPLMDETTEEAQTKAEARKALDPSGAAAKLRGWQQDSERYLMQYHQRWAKNMRMMKGLWDGQEKERSTVRNRSKLYFRKVWSTVWRLTASLYNAYLQDPGAVHFTSRFGELQDVHKAGVLQVMVEMYVDKMKCYYDLFVQLIWAFMNILTCGWTVGLFSWEYDKARKVDRPRFMTFPCEQVYPDMRATLPHEMQYIIFESYHTLDKLKENKRLKNLDQVEPKAPTTNVVRAARYTGTMDPLQNPGEKEYPEPGRFIENQDEQQKPEGMIKIWQAFYWEGGKVKYCITDGADVELLAPEDSKYGDKIPAVVGMCLTEPHKLIGEGWPEPLEGPQVSLNDLINRRKDNIALAMNKHTIVSRYGNVDLASLINSGPGAVTLVDDVAAVKEREIDDVTKSAYVEASADEGMMQEMSGVTPAKQGLETASKATVAQINLGESNAKIDLFIALVGETFMKSFYDTLAYLVQRFSTDQGMLKKANNIYRQKANVDHVRMPDVESIDELEVDIVVDVGIGTTNRQMQIQQLMLAMDRSMSSNQALTALLASGAVPHDEVRFVDISKLVEDLLPKIGVKNPKDYFFTAAPPPPEPPPNGGGAPPGMPAPMLSGLMPAAGRPPMRPPATPAPAGMMPPPGRPA